jgi:hypothetical protein
MSIQNEFLLFYNSYQTQTHHLIKTKPEYEFLCRRYQVFHQIDLFSDNKTGKNLEKYLQYWFHYEKQLIHYFQQLKQSQVMIKTCLFLQFEGLNNLRLVQGGRSETSEYSLFPL